MIKTTLSIIALVFSAFIVQAQKEAAWIRYASISPNGENIVFSYAGDLFVIGVNGGTATPITTSDAYDFMPVWSPDGSKIAFASNRFGNFDVFVMNASGGEATRLTYHSADDSPSDFSNDGKEIIFWSSRRDAVSNQQFPTGAFPELYSVSIGGGREKQINTLPMLWAKYNRANSDLMVYQDQKGYENEFRKHHTSSVTRDIAIYNAKDGSHKRISTFEGEDLNPVFAPNGQSVFWLTEKEGIFNVVKYDVASGKTNMMTSMKDHPVRYLSVSNSGILCFTHHGFLYTLKEGGQPVKVPVQITQDDRYTDHKNVPVAGASEFEVSPSGKEIVFVHRGEVFVSSVAEGTTKRITNTPEQERNVSFSPDGRSILYAGERNGSWNLYIAKIARAEEVYFFNSTLINEEAVLTTPEETFQASFSPDGKEVAFLEERTALRVLNLASKQVRTIVPADRNYSYSDGDQFYQWSPDGKWFLVNYLPKTQWISQMGLVAADGKSPIVNLSESGYGASMPRWMMDGKMAMWISDRDGQKNHASWGGEVDVYASFFTQEAYDVFKMTKEEYELYKENESKSKSENENEKKNEKKNENESKNKSKKKSDEEKDKEKEMVLKPVEIQLEGMDQRKVRLTIHSSELSDAWVSKDGANLYYICQFEQGYDLWQTDLRTKETKILQKLNGGPGAIVPDTSGKVLFVLSNGAITKIDLEKNEMKPVPIKGDMVLNEDAERAYLFEHIWRQAQKKFYVSDLHNVAWDFYKKEYAAKVAEINNNYDFAELMSELLGELNASHTGAYYGSGDPNGDQTASLGLYYDEAYMGDGLKIAEVMKGSPVIKQGSKIKEGVIIEKIDGVTIKAGDNYFPLLNKKVGVPTLLSLFDPKTAQRWDETVKPFHYGNENELMYRRWVENCRHLVDSLSGGKLGYVHVRGMDDRSFRKVYEDALGKYGDCEGLVVDTRFNGGGWLHDDLATFLSGKTYMKFVPRGQHIGNEPEFKWKETSIVVMNESNYSDAHMFPYTYRALGVGKLVGMPVAGTGTAVWWEPLQNGVVFGIPQVGMIGNDGKYLENQQLEPDYKVDNRPETVILGRDEQLEKAVEVLMKR